MQGSVIVSGAIYLCCFLLEGGGGGGGTRIAHRLPGYLHRQGRWASFLYRERLDALLNRYLVRLFRQDHVFSLLEPANDHFHVVGAQRVPIILSSISLAPPASSLYLDANEEIDLHATELLDC